MAVQDMRDYQRRIYQESMNSNALVVLPTGSGKTRIASQHIKRLQGGKLKVLFLVPTCLLVDQQAQALRKDTGSEVNTEHLNYHCFLTLTFEAGELFSP